MSEELGVIETVRAVDPGDAIDALRASDPPEWIEEHFYIPPGGRIKLAPHQKIVLRIALSRRDGTGRFIYTTVLYSQPKKSGKTTISGAVGRYFAETQAYYGEIFCVGNDLKQATERAFRELSRSIQLTPGYIGGRDVLPGRWDVLTRSLRCTATKTNVSALAVDARGEAGGAPALTIWTELWGFEYAAAIQFWDELTTVPTIPDSMRWVETYAGFEGESMLLWGVYQRGLAGRQLTNGEAARLAARDKDGERYEDLIHAWRGCWPNDCPPDAPCSPLCAADPDALVPIWVSDNGMFMYWDEGEEARRMPWQRGERGLEYYREQEESERPNVYLQHHHNRWTGSESNFVPLEIWDGCRQALPPFLPGDPMPCVVGVDAASTGDCFGIVVVTRWPDPAMHEGRAAVRACKLWTPPQGGRIDYIEPEGFIRWMVQGGCARGHPQYAPFRRKAEDVVAGGTAEGKERCPACDEQVIVPGYKVIQVAYDPYQMEDMSQRLMRDRVIWCEAFNQKEPRLRADRKLYDLIIQRKLAHDGNEDLRQHIRNSNAKTQKDQDSTLRIVKKSETGGKIDLVVAASMAVSRCLDLLLPTVDGRRGAQ